MDHAMTQWIAEMAIGQIRRGSALGEQVAYSLGGIPYVDAIREQVQKAGEADVPHVLRLIRDRTAWWHRYLGTNIARPLALNGEIVEAVRSSWKTDEHFRTKLAMIYFLLHRGLSEDEIADIVEHLDEEKVDFIKCIKESYERYPRGTWEALCLRLENRGFRAGTCIYLLSLSILAESASWAVGRSPDNIESLRRSESRAEAALAKRLTDAIEKAMLTSTNKENDQ